MIQPLHLRCPVHCGRRLPVLSRRPSERNRTPRQYPPRAKCRSGRIVCARLVTHRHGAAALCQRAQDQPVLKASPRLGNRAARWTRTSSVLADTVLAAARTLGASNKPLRTTALALLPFAGASVGRFFTSSMIAASVPSGSGRLHPARKGTASPRQAHRMRVR